jgi:hypothetical protein
LPLASAQMAGSSAQMGPAVLVQHGTMLDHGGEHHLAGPQRPAAWALRSSDDLRRRGWRPGSDRDRGVPAVGCGEGLVVEPSSALGEVAEVQRAADRNRHRSAPGAVRAPPQRVGQRVPVIEVADHRHRAVRLVGRQRERDADGAVPSRPGCLDQLLSPLRRSTAVHAFDYLRTAGTITRFKKMATWRVASVSRGPKASADQVRGPAADVVRTLQVALVWPGGAEGRGRRAGSPNSRAGCAPVAGQGCGSLIAPHPTPPHHRRYPSAGGSQEAFRAVADPPPRLVAI